MALLNFGVLDPAQLAAKLEGETSEQRQMVMKELIESAGMLVMNLARFLDNPIDPAQGTPLLTAYCVGLERLMSLREGKPAPWLTPQTPSNPRVMQLMHSAHCLVQTLHEAAAIANHVWEGAGGKIKPSDIGAVCKITRMEEPPKGGGNRTH